MAFLTWDCRKLYHTNPTAKFKRNLQINVACCLKTRNICLCRRWLGFIPVIVPNFHLTILKFISYGVISWASWQISKKSQKQSNEQSHNRIYFINLSWNANNMHVFEGTQYIRWLDCLVQQAIASLRFATCESGS